MVATNTAVMPGRLNMFTRYIQCLSLSVQGRDLSLHDGCVVPILRNQSGLFRGLDRVICEQAAPTAQLERNDWTQLPSEAKDQEVVELLIGRIKERTDNRAVSVLNQTLDAIPPSIVRPLIQEIFELPGIVVFITASPLVLDEATRLSNTDRSPYHWEDIVLVGPKRSYQASQIFSANYTAHFRPSDLYTRGLLEPKFWSGDL